MKTKMKSDYCWRIPCYYGNSAIRISFIFKIIILLVFFKIELGQYLTSSDGTKQMVIVKYTFDGTVSLKIIHTII